MVMLSAQYSINNTQVHDVCDFSGSQGGIKTVIRIPPDQQVGDDHGSWRYVMIIIMEMMAMVIIII